MVNPSDGAVSLRDLPYPYDAMLAICSDLDETPSAETYLRTSEYLNTRRRTSFGEGVGLEVGNTIYFYMDRPQFAYWNATESEQSRIRDLIRSGHVDCIHSFGDSATSRVQAQETLEHLERHGCRFRVWIDHAVARTNFGPDIMQGFGDVVGDAAYHADLTLGYGVEYVWRGRVTSMHGQDAPPDLSGIWRASEPFGSLITLGKESSKIVAATLGSRKYRIHRDNRLLKDVVLRDSRHALEFLRSNPHPRGVSSGDNAAGLAEALSGEFLERLVKRRGKAVIYTHLGKRIDPHSGFPESSRVALENLADRVRAKQLLVATTERVLDYARTRERIAWRVSDAGDVREINLEMRDCGPECDGLSFVVPAGVDYRVVRDGSLVETKRSEPGDGGRAVIYVPWRQLDYSH